MPAYPAYYRDTFNPAQHRTRRLHVEDQYFPAQDLNESLSAESHARKTIGDAILADGEIVRGAGIAVDGATGAVTLEAGGIYVQGMVRELEAAGIAVPIQGEVLVGVVIEERVITSLEDPDLVIKSFATKPLDAHLMPRSPALQELPRWGSTVEALIDTVEVGYRFYPVYTIRDGQLVNTSPQSDTAAYVALIERYDRESNGHYIVSGCGVTHLRTEAGAQIYTIGDGTANVLGRKVDRLATTLVSYVEDPDLERINAEPHIFTPDGAGAMRITLNRTPVQAVHDVSVLTEKTVTVTRGQSTGGRDPLPDAQIQQILEIKQGAKTYANAVDYHRLGDEVDWSPSGGEPAPGSTYQVTYRYKQSIAPLATDETSVTVSGAVSGSEVDIDYSWRMPRYDVIALSRDGAIIRIRGVASPYSPQRPIVPDGLLELAQVTQRWAAGYPIVTATGMQAVPTPDLEAMRGAIIDLYRESARTKLKTEALARNPAAVNGIFVDNFDNAANRDVGVPQTAIIAGGVLQLPSDEVSTAAFDREGAGPETLPYTLDAWIEQSLITGRYPPVVIEPVDPVPTYEMMASAASVDEGETVTFTLRTTNVAPGTIVPIAWGGTASDDDFEGRRPLSMMIGAAGLAQVTLIVRADQMTEGAETVTLGVAGAPSVSVSINDTSVTPAPDPAPTYALGASHSLIDEGETVTFTLRTTNVAPGTSIPVTWAGTASASDFEGARPTAFAVGTDGRATIALIVRADQMTEGAETVTIGVPGVHGEPSVQVVIRDSSTAPAPPETERFRVLPIGVRLFPARQHYGDKQNALKPPSWSSASSINDRLRVAAKTWTTEAMPLHLDMYLIYPPGPIGDAEKYFKLRKTGFEILAVRYGGQAVPFTAEAIKDRAWVKVSPTGGVAGPAFAPLPVMDNVPLNYPVACMYVRTESIGGLPVGGYAVEVDYRDLNDNKKTLSLLHAGPTNATNVNPSAFERGYQVFAGVDINGFWR